VSAHYPILAPGVFDGFVLIVPAGDRDRPEFIDQVIWKSCDCKAIFLPLQVRF